jgi:ATP-dependent DNA helicase MPH1
VVLASVSAVLEVRPFPATSAAMMNSDDYFDDDLDSGILNQLDIIEAAHRLQPNQPQPQPQPQPPKKLPQAKPVPPKLVPPKPVPSKQIEPDDSFVDLTLDIDEADLQRLDSFIDAAYKGNTVSATGPSNLSSSKNSVQTTLFGETAVSTTKAGPASRGPVQRSKSNPRNPFGHQAPKTKQWDHTAFAKSGWKKPKSESQDNDAEGQEGEEVEFEQFPAPFISGT